MLILVTGATGKQGSAVVRKLLTSNKQHTIRALTRSPNSPAALALAEKGVQTVQGSLDNKSSLVSALKGVDTAFLINADGPEELRQAEHFVSAATEARLPFLVYASAEGAGQYPPALKAKLQIEEMVKASGIPFLITRPVAFYENLGGESWARWMALGLFDAYLKGQKLQMVAVDDIANAAVRAFEEPRTYASRTIPLLGEERSIQEVLDIYSEVEGKRATKAPRWLGGLVGRFMPKDLQQLFKWFGEVGYSVKAIEGQGSLTFEEWARLQK